ncbi:DUF1552 domain-containing protein [Marinagarivorans algicola]|uniref:DUF1552 domain-containing protein n=1 Tax=Marinagarivorans algicola TaxID=1513270 RepID=UPI0009EC0811|nr:DUF1552 domain-containing protein [Marinagarivorans algicola]
MMNKITERTTKALNSSRRRFLENMGKCGLPSAFLRASPLATAILGSRYAQAATANKKFVLIYHPNGKPEDAYGGGGTVNINSTALKPLAPHASDVAALEMTISMPGNHGNLWLAAGASSYNSQDVKSNSVNVQASNVLGNNTPFRSLQLGVFSGDNAGTEPTSGSQTAGIDRLKGSPLAREWNSQRAIASIFRDTPAAPSPGDSGPSAFQRRLSAYDANMKALDALERKLGQDEKSKLANHRAAVERLQKRAQAKQDEFLASQSGGGTGGSTGGGSCGAPSVSPVGNSALTEYKAQADVAVAALKCGLTNVCSIQFSETQASWKPNDGTADAVTALNAGQDHHNGGNHGNPAALPDILAYMNKGVAHLIAQLKQEDLFKDTVVCVISEMGEGINHLSSHGPITVASGINGFRAGAKRVTNSHTDVFADVFTLLGLESSVGGGQVGNYGTGGIVV